MTKNNLAKFSDMNINRLAFLENKKEDLTKKKNEFQNELNKVLKSLSNVNSLIKDAKEIESKTRRSL